jgi:hypothetical protein
MLGMSSMVTMPGRMPGSPRAEALRSTPKRIDGIFLWSWLAVHEAPVHQVAYAGG